VANTPDGPEAAHLNDERGAAAELSVPEIGGSSSDLSCPTSSTSRADSQHTSHITKSTGTEMEIVVIDGTSLTVSKLVAAITQVSHA
jgi:hypothetical protein